MLKIKLKTILINFLVLIVLLIITDRLIPFFSKQISGDNDRYISLREHNPKMDVYIYEGDRKIRVRTDENGFIIGPNQNLSDSVDFIFLGGSTTESFFVDEDKRFPYLSIKMLSDELNSDFVSLNGGVSGNNIYHSYIKLISKVIEQKPRYVILMNAVNDYSYLNKYSSYFEGPRGPINENKITVYNFLKSVKDYLIPNLYTSVRSVFLMTSLGSIPGGPDSLKVEEKSENPIKDFERGLRVFIKTSIEFDIEPILMTQFNNYENEKILTSYEMNDYNQFNNSIRNISSEFNLKLIDLELLIPKKAEFFYDGGHLNNKGSILASSIIKDFLKDNLK